MTESSVLNYSWELYILLDRRCNTIIIYEEIQKNDPIEINET